MTATALGAVAALVFAYLASIPFHPTANPIDQFAWLYGRYQYASGVYPYNSVNAFNLYSMVHHFWEPDNQLLPSVSILGHTVGLPQYIWGIVLFLEGAMILSLAYFVLLTRMHERYIFDAFLLAIPLVALRRRYLWAAIVLSLTLLANLFYSLDYLHVMSDKVAGVDPADLIPWLSHPMSLLNVAAFFYLGFVYLGASAADPIERIAGSIVETVNGSRHQLSFPGCGCLSGGSRRWPAWSR